MTTGHVAEMVLRAGMAAYRADRGRRYALQEVWVLPLLEVELPAYDGPLIRVEPVDGKSRVTVKPYAGDVCDGATMAPDWPRGVIPATLLHDPWYLEIPAMAAAWDWSEDRVRKIGDGILSTIMLRAGGSGWLARLYYNAVFHLGGVFRRLRRRGVGVTLVVAVALAGMAGCMAPVDWSDPAEPLVPPVYEGRIWTCPDSARRGGVRGGVSLPGDMAKKGVGAFRDAASRRGPRGGVRGGRASPRGRRGKVGARVQCPRAGGLSSAGVGVDEAGAEAEEGGGAGREGVAAGGDVVHEVDGREVEGRVCAGDDPMVGGPQGGESLPMQGARA